MEYSICGVVGYRQMEISTAEMRVVPRGGSASRAPTCRGEHYRDRINININININIEQVPLTLAIPQNEGGVDAS
eukprot:5589357-Pyramimonas_sp.AAC.1